MGNTEPPVTGPNPIDTIREALDGIAYASNETYQRREAAKAALTEVEQQLAVAEADRDQAIGWATTLRDERDKAELALAQRLDERERLMAAEAALAEANQAALRAEAKRSEAALCERQATERAEAAERRANDLEKDRDEWIKATADNGARADDLADALRDTAHFRPADWEDDQPCWCWTHTPNHSPACLAARAALDRHTKGRAG